MAQDRLVLSQEQDFAAPNRKKIRVWVKIYESGRTRVIIESGQEYNIASIANGGNSDAIKVELVPA